MHAACAVTPAAASALSAGGAGAQAAGTVAGTVAGSAAAGLLICRVAAVAGSCPLRPAASDSWRGAAG